mmetsp:Transcript_11250/g.24201  ORF Transcript_11250/g.24201 Transcript_11250/m.24201 type:complete len:89 (-) Transcript_11250:77-343(-)
MKYLQLQLIKNQGKWMVVARRPSATNYLRTTTVGPRRGGPLTTTAGPALGAATTTGALGGATTTAGAGALTTLRGGPARTTTTILYRN